MLEYVYLPAGLSTEGIFYPTASDYSRQCECVFARTIRANCSRELFARKIRVSVKRPVEFILSAVFVLVSELL